MVITGISDQSNGISYRWRTPVQRTNAKALQKTSIAQSFRTYESLVGLREALTELGGPLTGYRSVEDYGSGAVADATESLKPQSTAATAATVQTSVDINAISTAYTPRGPSFAGESTRVPTIGGTYNGSNGTDSLKFTVTSDGLPELTNHLTVTNSEGKTVDSFNLSEYQSGTPLTMQNGLSVTLGSGTLATGDSFYVDVTDSKRGDVDPTAAIAESGRSAPGMSEQAAREFVDRLEKVAARFNEVFDDERYTEPMGSLTAKARSSLRATLSEFFQAKDLTIDGESKVDLEEGEKPTQVFSPGTSNRRELEQMLRRNPSLMSDLLFGEPQKSQMGLVGRLQDAIKSIENDFRYHQYSVGRVFNVVV